MKDVSRPIVAILRHLAIHQLLMLLIWQLSCLQRTELFAHDLEYLTQKGWIISTGSTKGGIMNLAA